MLIKKNKNNGFSDRFFKNLKSPIFKFIIFSIAISFYTFFISFIFNLDKTNLRKKIPIEIKSRIKDSTFYHIYKSNYKLNIPKNIINATFTKAEKIYIDLKYKDLEKLNKKREKALNNKVLISNEKDFVNAYISNSQNKLDAKIRLKGDWSDHLIGNKWSFRVKIDDGKTFNGLNKFSLQSPKTRNFIWEWIYHEILRIEGFPALRYSFAPLIFNGNNLGVYAIEEHFDKILLESNKYKEGPIIKLSESLLWLQRNRNIKEGIENIDSHDQITRTYVDVFKKKYTLKNKNLHSNYIKATQKLNSFLVGKLTTSEVFDINKLAKFLAISDLLNAHHGVIWHNLRFYFDPISELLIPIGFDGNAGEPLTSLAIDNEGGLNYFNDLDFVKKYVSELERISREDYLDSLFKEINSKLNYQLSVIHKSYPGISFNKKLIINNQKKIVNSINPINPLNAYLGDIDNNNLELNIANNQSWPIEIFGVFQDKENIGELIKPILIKGKSLNSFPEYRNIKFSNIKKYRDNRPIKLYYKIYGNQELKKLDIKPYQRLETTVSNKNILNLSKFNFLIINQKEGTIRVSQGNWLINKPLIIPLRIINLLLIVAQI